MSILPKCTVWLRDNMTLANLSGRFKLLEHQCSVYDWVNLNAQGGQLVQCCCLNACMLAEEDAAYIMYALCNAAYVMLHVCIIRRCQCYWEMQPPYIYWLHLLMTTGYCYVEMQPLHCYVACVWVSSSCQYPQAIRKWGAGVPYVLSSVPYVSPAAAIDLATGNRNVDWCKIIACWASQRLYQPTWQFNKRMS